MRRLQSLLSDAFWLYLFPAAAIILPWPWYFALCKRLAKAKHPYRAAIERELGYARTLLPNLDPERFRFEHALTKLIDAADFYLNLARSHRWFRRYVRVDGCWPDADQPMLLLGSHWGAGHWIWRDLRRHGIRAWFVARQSDAADFGRGRLARWYGRFRGWGLRRAGCAGVITTGGARAKVQAAFDRAEAIVALNDVPVENGHACQRAILLGRDVTFPTGLIDLAIQKSAAIVWFTMALNPGNGTRTLRIHPLSAEAKTTPAVIRAYAANLSPLIEHRPGSWQTWALAPALFGASER